MGLACESRSPTRCAQRLGTDPAAAQQLTEALALKFKKSFPRCCFQWQHGARSLLSRAATLSRRDSLATDELDRAFRAEQSAVNTSACLSWRADRWRPAAVAAISVSAALHAAALHPQALPMCRKITRRARCARNLWKMSWRTWRASCYALRSCFQVNPGSGASL